MKFKNNRLIVKTDMDAGYIKIIAREECDGFSINVQYSMKKNGMKQIIKGATKIIESIFQTRNKPQR